MATETKVPAYVLTQDQINEIAAIAGKEAVHIFRTEQVKAERKRAKEDNKVKKTKKMLSSYRRIKATLADETEFTEEEQIELRWKFIEDLMGNAKEIVGKSERTIEDTEKRRREDLYCIYRIEKATEMDYSQESRHIFVKYLSESSYSVLIPV